MNLEEMLQKTTEELRKVDERINKLSEKRKAIQEKKESLEKQIEIEKNQKVAGVILEMFGEVGPDDLKRLLEDMSAEKELVSEKEKDEVNWYE